MKEVSENLFKVGYWVFDIRYGWGVVTQDNMDGTYKIEVTFADNIQEYYTDCGFCSERDLNPMLSYTEYTHQGFSQEIPKPNIAVGQIIFVKDYGVWTPKRFYKWEGKYVVCFSNGIFLSNMVGLDKESVDLSKSPTAKFGQYSIEDPYKDIFELGS